MKSLNDLIRTTEDIYQNSAPSILKTRFSNVLNVCFFIFSFLSIPCFFIISFLSKVTAKKIPDIKVEIENKYSEILIHPVNAEIELINQAALIENVNPLIQVPRFIISYLFPTGLYFLFPKQTEKFWKTVDRTIDASFRKCQINEIKLLNFDGNCYGLEMVWFATHYAKREEAFFKAINKIINLNSKFERRELNDDLSQWVMTIASIQSSKSANNKVRLSLKEVGEIEIQPEQTQKFSIKNDRKLDENLKAACQVFTQVAIQHKNKLIGLRVPIHEDVLHAVSVIYHQEDSKNFIDYFDANFHRARFKLQDINHCIEGMKNLLKYAYLLKFFIDSGSNEAEIFYSIYKATMCYTEKLNSVTNIPFVQSFRQAEKSWQTLFFSCIYSEKSKGNPGVQKEWDKRYGIMSYQKSYIYPGL